MKEEWLFHGAVVPIDVETTAALVAEIKRLIDVIGGMALAQPEQKPMHPQLKAMLEEYFYKTFAESAPPQHESTCAECDKNQSDGWALYCVDCLREFYKHDPTNKRTWVGLTDEEIKAFDTWHDNREEEVGWCNPSEIVAYIEAKLKDKNTRGQK